MEPWIYYTRRHNINILKDFPLSYSSYPSGDEPLYWYKNFAYYALFVSLKEEGNIFRSLPRSFLGDRITSYNGFIRFRISNDDNKRGISDAPPDPRFFKYYPQVVLVGFVLRIWFDK